MLLKGDAQRPAQQVQRSRRLLPLLADGGLGQGDLDVLRCFLVGETIQPYNELIARQRLRPAQRLPEGAQGSLS